MTQKYIPYFPLNSRIKADGLSVKDIRGYLVELEPGVWLAPWSGDPGRTKVKNCARRYRSEHGARIALGLARKCRPFKNAKVLIYVV